MFEQTSQRVYGYVRRHCDDADCDDVVAEVFLVAWRRFGEVPPDPVPWLLANGASGAASIGIYLLALGLILIVAGVILPAARNSAAVAIIAGLGAAPLFIAWNNREGPGTVCRSGLGGTSCVELWNPWPFLTVGVALVAVGVGMAWWSRRPG